MLTSKVIEYILMLFFAFVSMIILYLIYFGLINSQKFVQNQINDEDYRSECNCLEVLSITDKEIVIRNLLCNYADSLVISWPDYEYSHNDTIIRGEILTISHNSSFMEQYVLHYNNCE